MAFLGKFLGSTATKKILLEALVIPAIGTLVGFEVQKGLIKREQKKMLKKQQKEAAVETEEANVEVVDINDLPD